MELLLRPHLTSPTTSGGTAPGTRTSADRTCRQEAGPGWRELPDPGRRGPLRAYLSRRAPEQERQRLSRTTHGDQSASAPSSRRHRREGARPAEQARVPTIGACRCAPIPTMMRAHCWAHPAARSWPADDDEWTAARVQPSARPLRRGPPRAAPRPFTDRSPPARPARRPAAGSPAAGLIFPRERPAAITTPPRSSRAHPDRGEARGARPGLCAA